VRDRPGDQHEAQGDHEIVGRRRRRATEPPGATTHTEAAATTVKRTAVLLPSHLALEFLAELFATLTSQPGFGNLPTSQSIAARRTPSYGWPIIAWLVS
jgi:hypothetical protein